jgi:hypothetical protein
MNNIQELVERLTDMCATEEGSPWPHDVMQCLIDCRSLLQAPLPDDVVKVLHAPASPYCQRCMDTDIADLLKRLWRGNQSGGTAFNAAIDFALDQCGSVEAADFLRAWREGDWDGIREAWPEFDLGTVDV